MSDVLSVEPPGQPAVENFLRVFFGPGNDADRYPGVTEVFKQFAVRDKITPVVLPRFVASTQEATMYVIADDPVMAPHVPEMINAFAGPTYCRTADLVRAELDPDDPVEAALLEHYGPDVDTDVLSAGSNAQHRRNLRSALQRMQSTLALRPTRLRHVDKSLGRLLGEFDAALASGGEATSEAVLSEIVVKGGLTASNLAHLRIKRLDRLGRGADLLALPELPGVLLQDPPVRIREAVFNAVYQVVIAPALAVGDVAAAVERLRDLEPALRLPVHDAIRDYDEPAATVLLVAAIGRADRTVLTDALALRESWPVVEPAEALWEHAVQVVGAKVELAPRADVSDEKEKAADERPLDGWTEFAAAVIEHDERVSTVIRDESWTAWPPLALEDARVRQLLGSLTDWQWAEIWQVVGVFVDGLGDRGVAPGTAMELIGAALTFDHLSRGDLLSLYSLTEIVFRSAPNRSDYAELLDGLRASAAQWASVQTADIVLDFADRLVVAASPDEGARFETARALLEPLHRSQGRLTSEDVALAERLCNELGVVLEWPPPSMEDDGFDLSKVPRLSVLLYSLDEAVLARVADQLGKQAAAVKVARSHDKVGTDSLRQKARNADIIVLATRCATHAATGFITENASRTAHIAYADGSGSASLLRAAVGGIRQAVI